MDGPLPPCVGTKEGGGPEGGPLGCPGWGGVPAGGPKGGVPVGGPKGGVPVGGPKGGVPAGGCLRG